MDEAAELLAASEPPEVILERNRRLGLWAALQAQRLALYPASLLNDLRVFYGGRGIWVHQDETRGVGDSAVGVTVGLLHTGSSYADDLYEDGVIYHYPQTNVPGRDEAEINATKAAMRLRLPVFVISYPFRRAPTRRVHLGWVDGYDDTERWFLVSFANQPSPILDALEELPFAPTTSKSQKLQTVKARPGQQRFKFRVFQRYGGCCAVCDMRIQELLEAAHVVPHEAGGTDDPRNGLVLCANHHRAFDRGLFGIEPESLAIEVSHGTAQQLGLTRTSLSHFDWRPHIAALAWRWRKALPSG